MTLLLKIINNNLDNDLVFYGVFIGAVGSIGYSFTRRILSKSYVDKGVQTDAGENLSDRPNQIIAENITSKDALSPVSSTFKETSTIIPTTSEVGTQTITEDVTQVNTEVVPNQNIVERVVDISNAEYIAAKVDQLNAIDPFSTTPWTPEKVTAMIDTLGIVNNLFN
jgi:hypothetical protein